MADRYDILVDDTGDLYAENGDFVIGISDTQHVQQILENITGSWKQFPLIGIGLRQEIKGKLNGELRRSIQKGLAADGYKVKSVGLTNDKLTINV